MAYRKFDRQRLFNAVVTHLFKQGRPAVNKHGACMYRAPNGCKCGIGGLIPDSRYDPELEGNSASAYDVMAACGFDPGTLSLGDERYLNRLQTQLHDALIYADAKKADARTFVRRLKKAVPDFAVDNRLTIPKIAR